MTTSSVAMKLFVLLGLAAMSTAHAETTPAAAVVTSASAVVKGASPAVEKLNPKVLGAGGIKSTGDSSIPAGSLPIPPKPKKEGLEAANVRAAGKGGDSSIPAGSLPIPPKPKKEGLEAAGAIKAKAAQP